MKHGYSAYVARKCGCEICRTAWATYTKEYRARDPEKWRKIGRESRRRQREANPELERTRKAKYREANRDKIREREREYRQQSAVRARRAMWREENREHIRAQKAAYRKANPDKWQEAHHEQKRRRRARLSGVDYEPYSRWAIYTRDRGTCHLCGEYVEPVDFSIDHLIPISLGGPDKPENVATAHFLCNSRRSARPLPRNQEAV